MKKIAYLQDRESRLFLQAKKESLRNIVAKIRRTHQSDLPPSQKIEQYINLKILLKKEIRDLGNTLRSGTPLRGEFVQYIERFKNTLKKINALEDSLERSSSAPATIPQTGADLSRHSTRLDRVHRAMDQLSRTTPNTPVFERRMKAIQREIMNNVRELELIREESGFGPGRKEISDLLKKFVISGKKLRNIGAGVDTSMPSRPAPPAHLPAPPRPSAPQRPLAPKPSRPVVEPAPQQDTQWFLSSMDPSMPLKDYLTAYLNNIPVDVNPSKARGEVFRWLRNQISRTRNPKHLYNLLQAIVAVSDNGGRINPEAILKGFNIIERTPYRTLNNGNRSYKLPNGHNLIFDKTGLNAFYYWPERGAKFIIYAPKHGGYGQFKMARKKHDLRKIAIEVALTAQ